MLSKYLNLWYTRMVTVIWAGFVLLTLSGCDTTRFIGKKALEQQVDYLNTPSSTGSVLTQLSDRVWTYSYYFDRSLVIDTDDGLVVVEPFNDEVASNLLRELQEAGINKPVHTLIYTHFHLDHTHGGAVLKPQNVICDYKCADYWSRFPPEETAGVLLPTAAIDGDTTLEIGGVPIQLIYLNRAHTDTNYAVYLPDDDTLFLSDMVGIKALLPAGGVSIFMPDYIAALIELQSLDFDIFVSSHFAYGTKADYLAAVQMQRDVQQWIKEGYKKAAEEINTTVPQLNSIEHIHYAFEYFYERMKERYGDWHGFDAQVLATFLNGYIAYYVGT